MTWVKIHDGMLDDDDIVAAGGDGLAMYVAGVVHCGRNLTDGFVHAARIPLLMNYAGFKAKPAAILARLVALELWTKDPDRDGYLIRNYLKFNPSRAEVEAERAEKHAARSAAGRRGGHRSGEVRRSKAEATLKQTGSTDEANGVAKRTPVPVPVPVPEELHTGVCSSPSAPPAEVSPDAALDGIYPGEVYWPDVWPEDFDPTTRPVLAEIARVNAPKCTDLRKQWAKFRAFALSEHLRTRRWDQRWARWTLDHDARPCACGWNPHAARRTGVVSEEDRASAARGMALVLGRRRAGEVANG